jgi:hypothetical protein
MREQGRQAGRGAHSHIGTSTRKRPPSQFGGGGGAFRTKRHDVALCMISYRPCGHRSCDIVHREEIAGMKTAISHTERK